MWKPEIEVGAILVAVLGLLGLGFYFGHLSGASSGRQTAATATAALQADHAAQLGALATAWQSRELQTAAQADRAINELDSLRAARAAPMPGIALRVCFTPPGAAGLPAGTDDPDRAPPAGTLPSGNDQMPRPSGDIRPGLLAVSDEADVVVAKCRRTQPVKPAAPKVGTP